MYASLRDLPFPPRSPPVSTSTPSSSERLTDSQGREWIPGAVLGRGIWGRSRLLRDKAGRWAVLKEPLTEEDFPSDGIDMSPRAEACRECAEEQARLLDDAPLPFLPRLEATVALEGGRTGLILPRYANNLEQAIQAGMPIEDVLAAVVDVSGKLAAAKRVHGNLRPTNVLLDDDGNVVLSDVATPALRTHRQHLVEIAMAEEWSPPEAKDRPQSTWDTWGLAQTLHAAFHAIREVDPPPPLRLAKAGLDKSALTDLKERLTSRLADEGSNPRFRERVADRMGALLSRALSSQTEPSPPYRFASCDALTERVREVLWLVRPHVEDVGRVMFPGRADDATFRGGEPVEFTVTVSCTPGVTDFEDLVCGIQLVDLDAPDDGRIKIEIYPAMSLGGTPVHPSGRLRYKLGLPGIPPGRYRVRVAFAVIESGDKPKVAESDLEVRPPPGYVPPRQDHPPSPLPFPVPPPSDDDDDDDEHESVVDEPTPVSHTAEQPLTDEIEPRPGAFPAPVAPAPVAPVAARESDEGGHEAIGSLYEHRALEVSPPRGAAAPDRTVTSTDDRVRPVELSALADDPLDDLPAPRGERIPDMGEDLPSWQQERGSSTRTRGTSLAVGVKRDRTSAIAMAIGAGLLFVLAMVYFT